MHVVEPPAGWVESRCGAVALGWAYPFPPLPSRGALVARPWLRFHTPLIEPDVRIARIRLSDKTSRLRPRHVMPKPAQAYEPEVPVEVREWIASAPSPPDFVLEAQPPAQPHRCVSVERPIRLVDGPYLEVVRVLCVKFCKGGHGWLESCGLAELNFLVLFEIVHIEIAVGFEPVLVGLDG
jgi:hypothetical protein